MSWLSFDDRYTHQRVWDDLPYETRWLFHAIVEECSVTRRYDGRLRWAAALRCSDVPDPDRAVKDLIRAGLLADLGGEIEVLDIDAFLPPEAQREENLLPRKRANQSAYRKRKCESGSHGKDCPAATCPVKLARVAGNAGTGRDGTGKEEHPSARKRRAENDTERNRDE